MTQEAARVSNSLEMGGADSPAATSTWRDQLKKRHKFRRPFKIFCNVVGISGFFPLYFWVLRNPLGPVTAMPVTAFDRFFDFCPQALPLYLSLWVYIAIPPALLNQVRTLYSYLFAEVVISVVGLTIFLFWPSAASWPTHAWAEYPTVDFIKSLDAPGNACPSLHAAYAIFSVIWLDRILRRVDAPKLLLILNWIWCLGIIYSTIAVRQHVIADLIAGAILGALTAIIHIRWYKAVT